MMGALLLWLMHACGPLPPSDPTFFDEYGWIVQLVVLVLFCLIAEALRLQPKENKE